MQADSWRQPYPSITPFDTGMLPVSALHSIYYEQCGNPDGKPVVFIHGGPGGGCGPHSRRYFDPDVYRIVLFDQRGCNRSRPHADIADNTTWHLVADMERLRVHLGIDRWQLFGGSWGSTLALAYAQRHPERVSEMVLRGIFTLRRAELEWFYQAGANALLPDAWEHYLAPIPAGERGDLISAYYRRLIDPDPGVHGPAARAWSTWEANASFIQRNQQYIAAFENPSFALAFARIECHYFVHSGFFEVDGQLLRDVDRIRHIPAVIVHGRYDLVCPLDNAWRLHRAWPEATLHIIESAGHAATEPETRRALLAATDRFRG